MIILVLALIFIVPLVLAYLKPQARPDFLRLGLLSLFPLALIMDGIIFRKAEPDMFPDMGEPQTAFFLLATLSFAVLAVWIIFKNNKTRIFTVLWIALNSLIFLIGLLYAYKALTGDPL